MRFTLPKRFAKVQIWSLLGMVMGGACVAQAFVLTDPDYRLAKPQDTVVNIASGGCQANGIPNSQLKSAVQTAIDQYWNTIAETKLRLRVGDEVPRSLGVGLADPGEILIGCTPLGSGGPSGVTYNDKGKGSSVIVLNGTTLVPGGFTDEGLLGVIAHEMGHSIGLSHSNDNASVMTYRSNGWSPAPTYLSQDDKDGVAYLYPNEGYASGLLGGCSAQASIGDRAISRQLSGLSVWLEVVLIWIVMNLMRRSGRRLNRTSTQR